jgi:general stress protein 26
MQGGGKYLSVTGSAELTDDQATINDMWSDAWKIWFPKGKVDNSIVLVKVVAEDGAYWDLSGTNRLRYLYQAGKAYFTGEEIDSEELNIEGKVNLR